MQADGIIGISPATWHPPTTIRSKDLFPVPSLVERAFEQCERDLARSVTSCICAPFRGGRTCVSCAMGIPAGSWAAPSQTPCTPTSSRTPWDTRSRHSGTCPARSSSTRTGEPIHQRPARQSRTRARRAPIDGSHGVCWDNAAAESFWSTFNNEYYHRHVLPRSVRPDAARTRGSTAGTTHAATPRSATPAR